MRGMFVGSVMALAALPAMAADSSFQTLGTQSGTYASIVAINCETCTDGPKSKASDYVVPDLAPGTQLVEIVETDKGKELVRTDAWLGGSPARRVSKTQANLFEEAEVLKAELQKQEEEKLAIQQAEAEAQKNPGVDLDAKTAALTPESNVAEASMAGAAEQAPAFNPADLQLRLN